VGSESSGWTYLVWPEAATQAGDDVVVHLEERLG